MNKKIFIVSLVLVGVLVAGQAEAANVFQKMFKRNATSTVATTSKVLNSDCIVKAVNKRETAIGVAYNDMTDKISAALSVRAKSLSASWAQTDRSSRVTSRNVAWKTFKDSAKGARDIHRNSVKSIWATYKADAANCRVDVNGVEPENGEGEL